MTAIECIRESIKPYGTISDDGAERLARRLGYLPTALADECDSAKIETGISDFIRGAIMHPTSVNENGFSQSWSADSIKKNAMLLLRQYGITPNDELLADIGISVIRDVSNIW